ncbi:DUF1697 domain-containing protein [Glycomyces algeriensis]|uniref:DUF1697 domain-containing protein n=1 Tax=Glycomyces algeriensis TaxID=256037 RepID=A0A9W6LHT9_9ACTN|nr:DUF1697 domain-containing protein [Glycomyces algeriensis]MDA1367408.1 DUF1697 domain-containing protein [Glycomyces algeriensis]MDR7350938.1 uncharacterized protein (DUF1697 family) [Glycomyces algeriensis]GLI43650.1 hypothetical protein GALLR39Z86_35000 [Glycomyces algeriensis]
MRTYAVLLRGVNVGGHRKVPMARLREALEAAGFDRVRTYIQSGNIVLDTELDAGAAGKAVAAVILAEFGHTVPVMVRTGADLDRVMGADPFAGRGLDESKVAVTFLSGPAPDLTVPAGQPEEAHVDGTEVWVYYPDGMGRSTLERTGFWKPLGGLDATARNLRTVRRLRDMAADDTRE